MSDKDYEWMNEWMNEYKWQLSSSRWPPTRRRNIDWRARACVCVPLSMCECVLVCRYGHIINYFTWCRTTEQTEVVAAERLMSPVTNKKLYGLLFKCCQTELASGTEFVRRQQFRHVFTIKRIMPISSWVVGFLSKYVGTNCTFLVKCDICFKSCQHAPCIC